MSTIGELSNIVCFVAEMPQNIEETTLVERVMSLSPKKSIEACNSFLESHPSSEKVFAIRASQHALLGHCKKASKDIYRVLRWDSNNDLALATKGEILRQKQSYSEAEKALYRSLEQNSNNEFALVSISRLFIDMNRLEMAQQTLNKTFLLNSQNGYAHFVQGLLFMKRGSEAEFKISFAKAKRLSPFLNNRITQAQRSYTPREAAVIDLTKKTEEPQPKRRRVLSQTTLSIVAPLFPDGHRPTQKEIGELYNKIRRHS